MAHNIFHICTLVRPNKDAVMLVFQRTNRIQIVSTLLRPWSHVGSGRTTQVVPRGLELAKVHQIPKSQQLVKDFYMKPMLPRVAHGATLNQHRPNRGNLYASGQLRGRCPGES